MHKPGWCLVMPHLILAEDSPTIQKLVQLCFQAEDFEVHCFVDRRSTLEYLETQPADVLLADISIPDLDGYELCRAVKQNPKTESLPVVLLVGVFDSFDVERAEQAGYTCRLTKPLGTRELVDVVKRLLDAPSPSPSSSKLEPKLPDVSTLGRAFDLPVVPEIGEREEEPLFFLTPSQCQASAASYTRKLSAEAKTQPAVENHERSSLELSLRRDEVDLLANRLFELLRPELRRMLSLVTQEGVKRGTV